MGAPDTKSATAKRSRKWYILNPGHNCLFVVSSNPDASGAEPRLEFAAFSEVSRHSALIDKVSAKTGVDARLIRAIMYVETTHGYYDAPFAWLGLNKSILPMNINVDYWGDAFGTREALKEPETNIKAGAIMLKRIKGHLPADAPISHIATLYNNINAQKVSNYGMRVQAVYTSQPWKTK